MVDPIRSEKIDYRRRARIGVRYIAKQNRLVMGFREHQSNHLTPIQQCHVLDQAFVRKFGRVEEITRKSNRQSPHWSYRISNGDTETALLIRHLDELNVSDVNQLRQFALLKDWQLYLQPKGRR
jgi:23S rRNA (uracil1939-C5)-methyltransferase